jgi:hypothetical protein
MHDFEAVIGLATFPDPAMVGTYAGAFDESGKGLIQTEK